MRMALLLLNMLCMVPSLAMTPIHVLNNYSKRTAFGKREPVPLNIRISGEGVGGCDIVLAGGGGANSTDDSSCKCLWGTVGYQFRAYTQTAQDGSKPEEIILCADTKSLGNCYHTGSYFCEVTDIGFCHCHELSARPGPSSFTQSEDAISSSQPSNRVEPLTLRPRTSR